MLKIRAYYQTQEALQKADEPFKSVATILDRLYLKGPNDQKALSYQGFKNTLAVSCIRDLAEDLANNQVTFVSRMKTIWNSLQNLQQVFSNSFENYGVPYVYYQGVIFGGVYYVLAKQKTVGDEHLDLMATFISSYDEAQPYFNVFKTAMIGDTRPLAPRPYAVVASKTMDLKTLRKQFIQNLNTNKTLINSVDWADATLGFDREVMKEIFWGIEDDATLKDVVKAILNTWNKLSKAGDHRCMEKAVNGEVQITLDPYKFGGMFKEDIKSFFDEMWVERNAQNIYATGAIGKDMQQSVKEQTIREDLYKPYEALLKTKDDEIDSLKASLEQMKQQNMDSVLTDENEIEDTEETEGKLYNKVAFELFIRLLEKAGFDINNTGNKTRVGELWHMVTGKSGDEIRRYCSTREYQNTHTKADVKRLKDKLDEMDLGDLFSDKLTQNTQ